MTVLEPHSARTEQTGPRGPAPGGSPPVRHRTRRLVVVALALVAALVAGFFLGRQLQGPRSLAGHGTPAPAPTPSSSYASSCLAVGAFVNAPAGGRDLALFHQAERQLGPLTIRRSFDPSLPSSFAKSSAAHDAAQGLHSFVSWKAPHGDYRGATAGKYDKQIRAWAKSVPRTGVFATAYHEPENNMSAADFVALQRHLYPLVKAANPTIRWGPVYMSYWWDPTQPTHYVGNPQAWWPGKNYADFVGLDWYGHDPQPMTTSNSFQNWYRTFAPTGLPLVIPEYGQYFVPAGQAPDPSKLRARVRAISQDAAWIAQHPQFKVWIYWQGRGPTGQWRLTDLASQQAWQSVADSGCHS